MYLKTCDAYRVLPFKFCPRVDGLNLSTTLPFQKIMESKFRPISADQLGKNCVKTLRRQFKDQ